MCGASLAAVALALPSIAHAQDANRNWDANGTAVGNGGTGTWSTNPVPANQTWSPNSDGVSGPYTVWDNTLLDNAIFGGTAGTVTLATPITVHNITFQTNNGYVLTGNTLTLAGTTPTITMLANATISSTLAGTAGLIKAGAGTLTLSGTNTFSGGVTINAGTLTASTDAALGAASNQITTAAGVSIGLTINGANTNRTVTIGNGSTLTVAGTGVGSALITGNGNVNVSTAGPVTLSNNANTYTGTTRFNGNGGVASSYFTSIADLGIASSLGAPTTVANGTITFTQANNYSDNLIYIGDGDSSNRNWVTGGGGANIFNDGTGTLVLTGDVSVGGSTGWSARNADIQLLGTLSGNSYGYSGTAGRTITLGSANTYTGATNVSGITLIAPVLANNGTSSSLGAGTTVGLGTGSILSYTGAGATTNRTWTSDGATRINNDGTGALTLSGGLSFIAGGSDTFTLGGTFGGTNTFSGIISGTGNVSGNGSGTWVLGGANSFTGTTTVTGGTLRAGSATAFGSAPAFVVDGGTLDLNGFSFVVPTLNGAGGTVALGSGNLTVNANSGTSSYAGSITGTGGLTKLGGSTLTLRGSNTYSGATTIGGGTLRLDFSSAGGPATDIVSASSTLNMSGGRLDVIGAAGESNTQTFNGLNVTAGSNIVSATSGAGGSLTVNLGTISRTGGLVNFVVPGSGNITAANPDGLLGGWATVGGADYAKVVGGNVVAFDASDYTDQDDASLWTGGQFISDSDADADSFFGTVGSSIQLGGLQFTTPDATTTVTIAGGQTLGVDGSIIVAPSVLTNNQTITGGSLTGGAGGSVLGVLQNGGGNFTIASTIVDNGGATGFVKGGGGTVTLSGANSYTGGTTLSQGMLSINSVANGGVASSIGASSAASSNLVLEGGILNYTGGTSATDRGFTLVNGGAGAPDIRVNGAANLTFNGLVTSPDDAGLTKSGTGTLTLGNAGNDYIGATTVGAGTLSVNTLANGGAVSGIGASSNASSNLVLQGGGRLQYTGATVTSNRGFTLGVGNGRIDVQNAATVLTLTGTAIGPDGLFKDGSGTLVLSGINTYVGGNDVTAGTLRAGSTQAFGAVTGGMNVTAGATLDLAGFNNTVAVLTGAGNVTLGSGTLTTSGGSGIFSGTISGTGGFTRSGGFTQTMSGCNNSYTGVTTINGNGTLAVDCLANGGLASGIGASGSGSASLVFNNGALAYSGGSVTTNRGFTLSANVGAISVDDPAATLQFTGVATGAGSLRKDGTGTLILSGANTLTGSTSITAGTLRAGSATALGTGAMTLSNVGGATLDMNNFSATFLYLAGGGAAGGNILLGSGSLALNYGAATTQTFAGLISGSGGLSKGGAATFVQSLTNCNNDYTGPTTITAGVLAVSCLANGGANSAIGASSSVASNLVINGGTLRYTGAAGSTDRRFTLGSSATSKLEASGTGAIAFTNTGAIAYSTPNTAQTITLGGTNTGNNSLAALITNNGSGITSLTKADAGTWILTNAASTYTGVTNINGGVLGIDKLSNGGIASSIGASSSLADNLVIGNNSTLRYTGTGDTTDRQFKLDSGVAFIESSGSGAIVFSNTGAVSYANPGAARTVALGGTNAGDNVMGASIGNSGGGATTLAKNDAGRWILTGNNTYTGPTNVNAGTLIIGNGGATGSITSSLVNNAGVLGFNRSDSMTLAGTIVGTGSVQQIGAGTTILTGASTYTGGTTIAAGTLQLGSGAGGGATGSIVGNVANNGTFAFNRSNALTFAGTISGTGQVSQIGSGTTTLTGTNSYSGGTNINAGTLRVSADANLGAASGGLRFNGGTLNTTASFTSARATSLAGAGTFLVDPLTTVTLNGAVSGGGTLTKTGTGTLTLAADNSYTGLTTINAGTLQVGNGGTTGSIVGNVVNNATLEFQRSDAYAYGGNISGTGALIQSGAGVLSLTGNSSYGGATTIGAGELRIAAGNTVSSGGGTIVTSAVLSIDGSSSVFSTTGLTAQSQSGSGVSATVNVQNGGVLRATVGNLTLRNAPVGPVLTSLNISGAGSLADVAGGLLVGTSTSTNIAGTTISAGGALRTAGASQIGAAAGNNTAPFVTITGPGSNWTSTSSLAMTNGIFSLLSGGTASFTSATIGSVSAARPATVLVSGTNSSFTTAGDLTVGSGVGTGELTLANGGRTIVGGALILADGATATGILNIGGAEGQAAEAAGFLDTATLNLGSATSRVNFNHTDSNYAFATAISGAGAVTQVAGVTNLTGNSTGFTGTTTVSGGTLRVNGTLGDATSTVSVATGGTLGGTGTIGGNVAIADGILAAGSGGVGALTINGNLSLGSASQLAFELGQASVPGGPLNDLVNVGGNLTLDGTVNVTQTAGGSFGPGVYRMFNYAGTLTDNGLTVGSLPSGTAFVQTAIANQVNLVNTAGLALNFWDGAAGPKNDGTIQGGNGIWRVGGGENNWTDVNGAVNADYAQNGFAIFQGTGDTVTVDNGGGAVLSTGMQFTVDGYTIAGAPLTLTGAPDTTIRVGDGGAGDAGLTATISAALAGSTRLVKTDGGTLVLGGVNTYTGGTAINGGTLRISADANLGDLAGALSINGGTLNTTASFGTSRVVTLTGSGTFLVDAGIQLNLDGVVSGAGAFVKQGNGTVILTADNLYTGGTTVSAGTLQIGNAGTTGSVVGDIVNNGEVRLARSDTYTVAGLISGTGAVRKAGGTAILTADNNYTGGTTNSSGILQLGNGGSTGGIVGDIINAGSLVFDRANEYSFAGKISGSGDVRQAGSGTTILTGANDYTGATSVDAGTLLVNGNQSLATGLTSVALGATLGGTGTIGGDVTLAGDAILAPGQGGPGTLTINGNLALAGTTVLAYDFGQSNVVGGPLNDLTQVGGNLTLDGTIDVALAPGGSFGPGLYRVLSYGGTLTDNGLAPGAMPAGSTVAVQTSIAGQVNLVNAAGGIFNFWDGAAPANESNNLVDGGNGIWQNSAGNNDWTTATGAVSGPYTDGVFAIFAAAGGTVSVDNGLGAVTASGLQFASDGYTITGQNLTLVGPQSIIRVGDGTALGLGYTATIDAALVGNTQLVKADLGTLVLSGVNTYTGGTQMDAGTLRVSSDANLGDAAGALTLNGGTLNTTADIASNRAVSLLGAGILSTDAGTTLTLGGVASGTGGFTKDGAGTLVLTGANSFSGNVDVVAGGLFVNGDQSAATGITSIAAGATLGGSGIIGGNVMLADGATLAAGMNNVGTLAINGNLALSAGSVLNYEFGQANAAGGSLNDLVNVGGSLMLDGTINVSVPASGTFGPGIYRVFNYAGALTDNGLTLGTVPGGSAVSVQTAVVGQVNLVNTAGLSLSFWDGDAGPKNNGVVNGGDGMWRAAGGLNNWTDQNGTVNADYAQDSFTIFSAAPGTVTIDNVDGAVRASGMQFASDGYVIAGDPLTLTGTSAVVQVGDGSVAGAGYTATIDAGLTGTAGLVKTDAGTLVLTGTNSYTGGTAINGGTLQVSSAVNLGDLAGGLSFNGGTLHTTDNVNTTKAVTLAGSGTLLTDGGTILVLGGTLSGTGGLVKSGAGTLVLSGVNSYTGGTAINGGTLSISSDANLGDAAGGLAFNGGTLRTTAASMTSGRAVNLAGGGTIQTDGALVLDGVISGTGALTKTGASVLFLTADNSYTGGTIINGGTLQLGGGGTTGSVVGDILNNGRLGVNRSDTLTLAGTISGTGEFIKTGAGTTILTGANSYSGNTEVNVGTLLINGDQSAATGRTRVSLGATLGGIGTIGGDVLVGNGDGILAPGAGGAGTLTINGDLTLLARGQLAYDFGAANAVGNPLNDLVNVGGDLTLDGTIDVAVTPGGAFDIGLYRVINYGGTLTDNGLAIGTMPAGAELFVQTSIAGQVNLINTGSAVLNFWDGSTGPKFNGVVNGGSGVWRAAGTDNWTDVTGAVNASYDNGAFAVFAGYPGTVTIDNSQGTVMASGLQFAANGYTITGGDLTLTGPQSVIRVGDGTSAGGAYRAIIASAIAGGAQLVKTDNGRLELTGANSYTGGTAINGGELRISSDANLGAASGGLSFDGGTLNTAADISTGRAIAFAGQAVFSTDTGTTLTLTGAVTGAGALGKLGAGTLVLAGTGSYAGITEIGQGTLLVNGDYAAATGLVRMYQGSTLGGTGTIGGNVSLAGTLAPGAGGAGTLTINGNLAISQSATLAWEFGQANVAGGALNDLVNVGGNLTLDGTINVAVPAGGAFDAGIYRVFNYGGTLTDNGLALGTMPGGGSVTVQTSIAGQVNLVNSAGLALAFWDGAAGPKNNGVINGGTGTWQNGAGNDNWTNANGTVNAAYSDGAFAVFGGTGGTVTVDNGPGQVTVSGMQFAANGYTISGGAIALTGAQSTARVGDGSTAGAGFTATINAALSGNTQLVKTDAGTLVLGGTNSYTGGTAVNGGTLQIASDANLGAASGGVILNGGTLATSATLTSARDFALTGAGTLATASGTTFTLSGKLTGTGAFTKAGAGTLVLTGDSSGYAGSTQVSGTLAVNGSLCGDVNVLGGARLQGTGTVCTTINAGTVAPGNSIGTLTVAGNYTGNSGTLEIETELGGDASPTDRLVVTGSTAGTTEVKVINAGGTGAATVEGIRIVDVGGASNGVFTLDGDYVFEGDQAVIAGAYGYRLQKNGVSTPADGDWYLRSSLLDAPNPNTPNVPLYQPGVPIYEAYGQTLLTLSEIGTLQQRIGNRQWAQTESGRPSGIWGRMQSSRSRPNAVRSTSLSDVNIDSWKLELGADHVLSERSDGASLVLGVLGGYGEANASVASIYGNGSIKAKGYSAGATLTWFGPQGFYVDGRAQVTWFDSKLKSAVLGTLADGNNGRGEAYSVEVGKRSPIGDTLSVTPQIQMVYSTVGFDRFTDPNGADVSSRLGDSLKTRWGLSLDRQDAKSHLYGVANLSYEWLDGTVTRVSGTPIARENHRLWGELGLGGSVLLGDRLTLYSEVSGNTAVNDFGKSYSLKGTAGLRLAF
ncbi:hypothetical protein ASE13_03470 [Sphingomonas sp. Root241]|nr:hypothetical protein ASE13_03470 [Sphingomonas sp. Root241]